MADNYVDAAHIQEGQGGGSLGVRQSGQDGAKMRRDRAGQDSNIKLIYACVSASHTNT